ncbi:MAG: 2-C-methyl-D-erythritol 4-phosphate cytidylyltransferase [Planctomycetota bacterium]
MSSDLPRWHAVVVAAGAGRRFGGETRKVGLELAGAPVVLHSVRTLSGAASFGGGVVVVHADDVDLARRKWLPEGQGWAVAVGGVTRAESVQAGLLALSPDAAWVAVHDAARPLVLQSDVEAVVRRAVEVGAAILATPVVETLKRVRAGLVAETIDRSEVWRAETPQVFRLEWLRRAYSAWPRGDTDDAALLERLGLPVAVVPTAGPNPKVTVAADLRLAERLLADRAGASEV